MLTKKYINISGITCQSCKTLIETEVDLLKGIHKVDVDHITGDCTIEFDDDLVTLERISKEIEKLNYKVQLESTKNIESRIQNLESLKNYFLPIIILVLIIIGYLLIKKYNGFALLSELNEQNVSYWMIFIIGLLASFHCIGMCGGLVVTYTAHGAAKNASQKKIKPHFQYNFGRLISYTLIGAVLGGIGSFFGINPTFTGTITLIAGIIMVLMGLSLATNFKWLKKFKIKTPDFIARFLYNQKYSKNPKGPLVIGLFNGFMPCGPLQAMQLYALTSGSIVKGGLSMFLYALGTIPLMFGFGSIISSIAHNKIQKIMKVSGIIVILLGILMINRAINNFGYVNKDIESTTEIQSIDTNQSKQNVQIVNMSVTYRGYEPNVLHIKKDIPVRWIINGDQIPGCTNEILMPEYNIKKPLNKGINIVEFTPTNTGEIKFSCWMRMVWGKFIVTE